MNRSRLTFEAGLDSDYLNLIDASETFEVDPDGGLKRDQVLGYGESITAIRNHWEELCRSRSLPPLNYSIEFLSD